MVYGFDDPVMEEAVYGGNHSPGFKACPDCPHNEKIYQHEFRCIMCIRRDNNDQVRKLEKETAWMLRIREQIQKRQRE